MPRKKVMAANWKMYKNPTQTQAFFQEFLPMVAGQTRDEIVVCPPYIDLYVAIAEVKEAAVAIGAQDLHWEKEGAYTGEICPSMLLDIGCTHVIIGHSERRQYFGETDDIVNFKLKAALEAGLTPIVCVRSEEHTSELQSL
jgi:triosephosphate isomerase